MSPACSTLLVGRIGWAAETRLGVCCTGGFVDRVVFEEVVERIALLAPAAVFESSDFVERFVVVVVVVAVVSVVFVVHVVVVAVVVVVVVVVEEHIVFVVAVVVVVFLVVVVFEEHNLGSGLSGNSPKLLQMNRSESYCCLELCDVLSHRLSNPQPD